MIEFDMEVIANEANFDHTEPFKVKELVDEKHKFDANPPYQRGLAWNSTMARNFILSLIQGAKISPITLVKKEKLANKYFVLDGKQRYEAAILSFVLNLYSIRLKTEDGMKTMKWKRIEKLRYKDKLVLAFYDRFMNATLDANIFKPMTIEEQKDLFNRINQSKSLNHNEKIFGNYYVTKIYFQYLFDIILDKLKQHVHDKEKNNKRFEGLRMTLELNYLLFGNNLNDSLTFRKLGYKPLRAHCDSLETYLCKIHSWDANTVIDSAEMKKCKLNHVSDTIEKAATFVSMCLSRCASKNHFKLKKVDLFDLLLFFADQYRQGVFNYSFCEKNSKAMYDCIEKYLPLKREYDLMTHTDDVGNIREKIDTLRKCFIDGGIDMEKKGRRPTDDQKLMAVISSTGIDPNSGRVLDAQPSVEYDHIVSTKLSSSSEVQLSSPSGNRVKSVV